MQQQSPIADIRPSAIATYFGIGVVAVVVCDIPDYLGSLYLVARTIVGLALLASVFLPVRKALPVLLVLAIVGKDIVVPGDVHESQVFNTASVWQMRFGPLNPSWIMFALVAIQALKVRVLIFTLPVKLALAWFITVPLITGITYGDFAYSHSANEFIIDLKFGMMLLASLIMFQSALRREPSWARDAMALLVGVLLARFAADLLYFMTDYGPQMSGVNRISLDSTKGSVVFLAYFGVFLVIARRQYILGAIIGIASVLLVITFGTRMLWVTFIIGAVVLMLLMARTWRAVAVLAVTIALTTSGGWLLYRVKPDTARVMYLRSATITEGRNPSGFAVGVESNLVSRIDPIRYGELINVLYTGGQRISILWGNGYGSYYRDKAVTFPTDLKNSFPEYSRFSGMYYRAHTYLVHVLFKHGLLGLILITSLWVLPLIRVLRIVRKRELFAPPQPRLFNGCMLCLLAFCVTAMFWLYWSGKGLFINGLVLALCMEFVRRWRIGERLRRAAS